MLNILLDVSRLLTRLSAGLLPTGIDRVGLAYLERYQSQARAVVSERGFSRVLSASDSEHAFNLLLTGTPSRTAIRKLVVRGLLNSRHEHFDRAVVLHTSHNGMENLRYYQAMQRRNVRSVFMVHDLIPLTHAEYCRDGIDKAHRRRIHTALRHADGLVANSQDTLNALKVEARAAGLSLPPSTVAHLASGVATHSQARKLMDTPYFVMLGTLEPRKNHWFMLHVWRKLVEMHGPLAPKLIVIGRRGWECENIVDMLERCKTIQGTVIEETDCSDERLHSWLQHARALIFPSFVEGYGMPLIEALELGTPVLASDLPVFHEIAGDVPDYLDPLDGPGWLSSILAYTQETSPKRAAQLARIDSFRAPTWQNHFERVDPFLDTLFA
ncbi:TPA: glycosyltransferase family 4 protein [Burkholderia cenocepacia]|uniref:glycosyltransferase family 4 protein n=1 Tax=Burkholderia cepacia complex TaxID=87882 RepID=UPI0009BED81C|nr:MULTISPECIES: glycosyltransferase family 1 protein [Burkholderia cepacia complex]MBR8134743.1 glycosyltransferase family 4 protein [Burkholderia cenocepacia]MCA8321008.1 glycosyltransferase family 4 protein [Burkholderia cepacia]MDI9678479.1 glycosyltransferase family 1 protein [Burkholderia cenocepacia]RQT79946.1 glycosyltransferase family 1 protein [Burkholderia cepacia]